MKILVANKMDWEHPEAGGVEVNLRETLGRLADRGHEVHLVTSSFPSADSSKTLRGVEIHRFGIPGRTNEITALTLGQLFLNAKIAELEPDIVFTVQSVLNWVPVAGDAEHVAAIHHLNGSQSFGRFGPVLGAFGYAAEKLSTRFLTGRKVIAVSDSTRNDIVEEGVDEEKIEVVRNGVNFEKYGGQEDAEQPMLLYLGRLEYTKGIDMVPEIFSKLDSRTSEEFRMVVAGKGSYSGEISDLAEEEERLEFLGHVSEERKKELLGKAWAVIVPSRKEGWGLTVSEANASGTPAVGFRTGGLKESIKDEETGLLVDNDGDRSDRIERFVSRLEDVVERDVDLEELSDSAEQFAREQSWEETVDRMEEIFSDVK